MVRLELYRRRAKLKVSELGHKLGMSAETIAALESGKIKLSNKKRLRVAAYFREPFDRLMQEVDLNEMIEITRVKG